MENKLSSKDYQPIRFHRGRPSLPSTEEPSEDSNLNEDDAETTERNDNEREADKEDNHENTRTRK